MASEWRLHLKKWNFETILCVCCFQEGWTRVNLASASDGQDLFLDFCDAYTAVLGLWRDPAHAGRLILQPKELHTRTGERRYKGAHTGTWWNDMQVAPCKCTLIYVEGVLWRASLESIHLFVHHRLICGGLSVEFNRLWHLPTWIHVTRGP